MKRTATLFLIVAVLISFTVPIAFAQTLADSTVVVATANTGPTLLDQIASMLAALTPIMTVLVGMGLATKYLPFMAKLPNVLIPFLNAVIAFLAVFAGPAPAHAGIFGDFVHALSFPAKAMGSLFLSVAARQVYETFLRGIFEKAGLYSAGLSKAEIAAKAKVTG
jgi:hypothetical protein